MNQDYFFIRIQGQSEFRKATCSGAPIGGFKLLDCTHPMQNCFVGSDEVVEIMRSLGPYVAPETKQADHGYDIWYKPSRPNFRQE